jgi:transcription factor IIIB 90 kDa subunit
LVLTTDISQGQTSTQYDEGNLSDLDDDEEVAEAIIDESSEHFILRAQIWMESNQEYLREQRGNLYCHAKLMVEKRLREEEDERNGIKKNQPNKRRQKRKKPEIGDEESAPATPAESAKQMVKQRVFSKKIDYSAMDRLFADD